MTMQVTVSKTLRPFHIKATILWENKPVKYGFHIQAKSSAQALGVVQRAVEKVYGRDAQLMSTVVTPI